MLGYIELGLAKTQMRHDNFNVNRLRHLAFQDKRWPFSSQLVMMKSAARLAKLSECVWQIAFNSDLPIPRLYSTGKKPVNNGSTVPRQAFLVAAGCLVPSFHLMVSWLTWKMVPSLNGQAASAHAGTGLEELLLYILWFTPACFG